MKTDDHRCRECGTKLIGKNAIDVGYCIPCWAMLMSDPDEDEEDFQPCSDCDGHDACADFGCAFKLGLGHLVRPALIVAIFIFSLPAFAQVPTYQIRVDVLDSMIFEVKRGRACDTLQKAQLAAIKKQAEELLAGYEIIRMQADQIKRQESINASWESTVAAMQIKFEAEITVIKSGFWRTIRFLKKIIVVEGGAIIILLILL